MSAEQFADALSQQLEARDREKAHDTECTERLEFLVAIGVIVIRLARRHRHRKDCDTIAQHVQHGFERGAKHGEGAGSRTNAHLERR
jgi:hypothetical protein